MAGSDGVATNFIAKLRLTAEVASYHPQGVGDGCCEVNGRRKAARGAVWRGAGVWRGAACGEGRGHGEVQLAAVRCRGARSGCCAMQEDFFRGISIWIAQI